MATMTFGTLAQAADVGSPGGPPPANRDAIAQTLRQDPYDLELLISYGTSQGGSAGHLPLAIREPGRSDDTVYSANFYADRGQSRRQNAAATGQAQQQQQAATQQQQQAFAKARAACLEGRGHTVK